MATEFIGINAITLRFICEHKKDDVRMLALHPVHGVDMTFALNQIQGWQTAVKKLPTWAITEGIIFPPHLNMEQCSSEITAKYKAGLCSGIIKWLEDKTIEKEKGGERTLVDLTGGFGVDFSFMSRMFQHAVYVERDERLCRIAKHNFDVLGLKNFDVLNRDGVDYLKWMPQVSLIYLDPARRDIYGRKVFGIEDCSPNILDLKEKMLLMADFVMVKLSPMLDWHETVRELGSCVREVHFVSVDNECKEMLVILKKDEQQEMRLVCWNDDEYFECNPNIPCDLKVVKDIEEKYLYVPNASIMKAGIFAQLTVSFPVYAVDKNSHLFLSNEDINDFPGRKFRIIATTTMNRKELKEKLKGIIYANIATRNFPLSVAQLRKRLKLRDGGDKFLFATTIKGRHCIIIATSKMSV